MTLEQATEAVAAVVAGLLTGKGIDNSMTEVKAAWPEMPLYKWEVIRRAALMAWNAGLDAGMGA